MMNRCLQQSCRMIRLISLMIIIIISQQIRIPCQFISSSWTPKQSYALSQREKIVWTLYNFQMIIDEIDGSVSQTIKNTGTWQPKNIHLITYFLKPNSTVLNIGSQTGLQAIIIGNLIRDKGKLIIFEPYSVSYEIAKKNIYLNNLEGITQLYRVGASDTQSKANMLIFKQNTGGAEIFMANMPQVDRQQSVMREEVFVDLVDQVLPQDLVADFVLMDVQKMEVEALLGMKGVIQRSKDIIILLEWQYMANSRRNQAKALRLIEWMKGIGMKGYIYEQNKQNKCSLGTFKDISFLEELLTLPVGDILLIPNHINPKNYEQQ